MQKTFFASRVVWILFLLLSCTGIYSQNIYTIAGNGAMGYSGDGGPATAADLYDPGSVAVDGIGNVYFDDFDNSRIRKISTAGIISTVAGNGVSAFSGDGGPATAAEISFPWGVAADVAGNVYIADCGNNRVRKVNTAGIITTIAGIGGYGGYGGDGGPATAANLYAPTGVWVDGAGNVYIAEQANNRIRKINTAGIITTVAGNGYNSGGNGGFSGDGGPATAAELYCPMAVTVDFTGNIYIADYQNQRIRIVNTSGIINTFAGIGVTGYSGDGGPATAAEFWDPSGVAADGAGNIYVAEFGNNVVRKINTSGIITTCAGTGAWAYGGDGGPAIAAAFANPWGVTTDCSGNIYVGDQTNQRVREIQGGASACQLLANFISNVNICVGDSDYFMDMSTDNPTSWSWTFTGGSPSSSSLQNPVVYYNSVGTYSVKEIVKKGSGSDSLTSFINVMAVPSASIHSNKDTLCVGDSALLTASGGSSYLWRPGLQTTSSINVSPAATSSYTVVVSNGACSDSSAITIVAPCTAEPCGEIFVPSAFSPNADGQNDILYVRGRCIQSMQFNVYDRWGNKVFESQNVNDGWDGQCNGQPMNTGTYVWYLNTLLNDGTVQNKKGTVTLVR